jgi:cell wall-associated NlpC family hydrolase
VKNEMLAKMLFTANYLVNDSNFQLAGNEMITGVPTQEGLAYSYGSKDYTIRQSPSFGECTDGVFGPDCSGFVYHLFKAAGINIPEGTAEDQRQVGTLNNAVGGLSEFSKVSFEDFGQIPPAEFESGDIIYWLRSNHTAFLIGMVLKTASDQSFIYQSNGTGRAANDCESNY